MYGNYGGYGPGLTNGWGLWGMMICGGLFFLVLLIGLILLLWWGLRISNKSKTSTGSPGESPLDILNRRYANGEIDKTEYDQKKNDLTI